MGLQTRLKRVAQFLDRYDQRSERRLRLRGQFREPRAILRQHLLEAPGARGSPRCGRMRAAIPIPAVGCSPPRFYQTCVNIQVSAALLPTNPPTPASARRRNRCASDSPSDAANRNARPSVGIAQHVHARRARSRPRARRGPAGARPRGPAPTPRRSTCRRDWCRSAPAALLWSCFHSCSSSVTAASGSCDADAAETAKRAECAHVLVRLQAILGVAVSAASTHASTSQPKTPLPFGMRTSGHSDDPYQTSVAAGKHLGAARIDQALAGAVVEKEGRLAGAAVHRGPRSRPAGCRCVPRFCSATKCRECRSTAPCSAAFGGMTPRPLSST